MSKHKYSKTELEQWRMVHGVGFVYYNRDDNNLIIEKASGLGFTLNFAHPVCYVIIGLIIGIIIAYNIIPIFSK